MVRLCCCPASHRHCSPSAAPGRQIAVWGAWQPNSHFCCLAMPLTPPSLALSAPAGHSRRLLQSSASAQAVATALSSGDSTAAANALANSQATGNATALASEFVCKEMGEAWGTGQQSNQRGCWLGAAVLVAGLLCRPFHSLALRPPPLPPRQTPSPRPSPAARAAPWPTPPPSPPPMAATRRPSPRPWRRRSLRPPPPPRPPPRPPRCVLAEAASAAALEGRIDAASRA